MSELFVAATPQFRVGDAIGWAWRLTWRNFWRYVLVCLVMFALNMAVGLVANLPTSVVSSLSDNADSAASAALLVVLVMLGIVGSVVQFLVSAFLALGAMRIALAVSRGERVEVGQIFQFDGYGWYLLGSLIVGALGFAAFMVPFGIFGVAGIFVGDYTGIALAVLGGLIGVIAAIVITIGFSLFGYAILDQQAAGVSSLGISWRLVKPRFWAVLGLAVLLALISLGLFLAAIILGILALIIGLLATLPLAGVITFGLGSLSMAYAYRTLSGQPVVE